MKCKKCGVEVTVGEKFCQGCGAKTEYADMKFGKIIVHRKSNFYGCAIPFKIFIVLSSTVLLFIILSGKNVALPRRFLIK